MVIVVMGNFPCMWESLTDLERLEVGVLPFTKSEHTYLPPHCSYTPKQVELFIISVATISAFVLEYQG